MTISRFSTLVLLAATAFAGATCAATARAQSTTLFYEDFGDATLTANGSLNGADPNSATIVNGAASFVDSNITGRATFSVVQNFDAPLMTFQFDFTAPIAPTDPARMEVILRAGIGTGQNTLSNAEHVVEAIAYRGLSTDATPARIGANNGNQSVFLVFNNKATEETFNSPVDGASVTLPAFNYVPYVLDRPSSTFTPLAQKGISHSNPAATEPAALITRFGIGSSTNADQGTFAIDNVLVRTGVIFDRNFPPVTPTAIPGDFDGDTVVDADDLGLWKARFGNTAAPLADADGDNDTDGNDFLIWQRNLGRTGATAAGAAVPEPGTAALAMLGMLSVLGGVRRSRS